MLKYTNLPIITLLFLLILSPVYLRAQSPAVAIQEEGYNENIKVGAEQTNLYLSTLKGKRVAIVGNQTTVIGQTHLVDSLLSLGVNVVKAFAPEHGFRGTADAGESIKDSKDVKTGIPIYSLHGSKNRKPKPEQLADVDVIIFDIQDVGARFYTYISTMHYVMESAAENGKLVMILDRPNPNGFYVDGPVLEPEHKSFVGMHKVPIVHGMTIGEYAQMLNGEGWLKNEVKCDLKIIKCANYAHKDYYKLPIKPSPNLPNMASIYLYPSICLFEGTNVSVGRGTNKQFQIIGMPNFDKAAFKFTPQPMPGAKRPKHKGIECGGYDLSEFGTTYIRSIKKMYLFWLVGMYKKSPDQANFFRKDGFFKLLCGNGKIKEMLISGATEDEILKSWEADVTAFKVIRKKYLLYTDFE
jgi:uncharacterized protein YbbC (DUF1343 family)